MKKKVSNVLKFLFLLLLMLVNCSQNSSSENDDDGKIKVNLINAETVNNGTECFFSIFEDGTDTNTDSAIEIMHTIIINGKTSSTSVNTYPEGEKYDIWIIVDNNGNADDDDPHPGGGDAYNDIAYNVTIDGDETITVDYNDLIIY